MSSKLTLLNKKTIPKDLNPCISITSDCERVKVECLLDENLSPIKDWVWVSFKHYPHEHWDSAIFFNDFINNTYDKNEVKGIDDETINKCVYMLKVIKKMGWF
jgi:hypothetical protein